MKKPDLKAIEAYKQADYYLIPLHKWDKTTTDPRTKKEMPRGKTPRDMDWRKRKYSGKEITQHLENGGNVGVKLTKRDCVLDVDPRNFPEGDNVLARFVEDFDIDLSIFPHVITGSGGSHYYMKKPEDVHICETLEDYPGLEFKTYGRQVVAAGSRHPNGELYAWDWINPAVTEEAPVPKVMLKTIKRQAPSTVDGGGEFTPEELMKMLEPLETEEYDENDSWMKIMMAAHHATNGDGRQEFIDWSIRDPKYADDSWIIGRRWDSLSAKGSGGNAVTYRTLFKELTKKGHIDAIPRTPPEDDFKDANALDEEDDPAAEEESEEERKSPLEKMNDKFCVVNENGKFKIYEEELDLGFDPPRKHWLRYTEYDFDRLYRNRKVQQGDRTIPITEAWLNWTKRRQVRGLVFDPGTDHKDYLNLWRGWAFEPKKGDWSLLQELISEVLCDGDEVATEYVYNWMADLVQNPNRAAEVALCFQGEKGTGKGTLGRALAALAGRHGLHITSPEHLTGRFNSHLRDCLVLFADEAVSPYDQAANSRLKGLITEPTLAIEGKGVDLVATKNLVHCIMASNEDWFVPMSLGDERRFFISKVNNNRQGDKKFFRRLHKQLKNGGYAAMLWDLLHRELGKWTPRDFIPATSASIEQKVRSLPPVSQWWFNLLEEGQLPFEHEGEWNDIFPLKVFKQDMKVAFEDWCRTTRINPGGMGRANSSFFGRALAKVCGEEFKTGPTVKMRVNEDRPDIKPHSDGRQYAYQLPSLPECRANMERLLGGAYQWGTGNKREMEEA